MEGVKINDDFITMIAFYDRKDYDPAWRRVISNSHRAVIGGEGSIALIHIGKYGVYAFPGGHAKAGETPAEALSREVREEAGLIIKAHTIRDVGEMIEVRKDLFGDSIYERHERYYSCEVEDAAVEPSLEEGEREAGLLLHYVGLDEAIARNEEAARDGLHWIDAETEVMKYMRGYLKLL